MWLTLKIHGNSDKNAMQCIKVRRKREKALSKYKTKLCLECNDRNDVSYQTLYFVSVDIEVENIFIRIDFGDHEFNCEFVEKQ